MNLRKLLAALFAAMLLLGACGSDDDGGDDTSSDTTEEEASDTTDDTSSDSGDSDSGDIEDIAGLDEDCLTASGAAISLGLMPLMFAFVPMGEAFTDDTLIAQSDIDEMEASIEDLQESVPDELSDDVETLADMSSAAFEDPEAFDEAEWEEAMSGINTYLEEECGDAFDLGDVGDLGDLEGDLEDLESELEDLGDITVPE
jgi:hypothetical protein